MTVKTVDVNSELYIPLLASLNVYPNEDGSLSQRFLGTDKLCTIGKRVVKLPLPEVINNLDSSKVIVFHPLAENVARGDSVIQNYLKQLITMNVSFKLFFLTQTLYNLAYDKTQHERLSGDQLTLLSLLPDADAKGARNLEEVISKVDMKNTRIYNLFNKRNGKLGEAQYNRVAVATFPLFSEILNPEKSDVWKNVRKRDLKEFKMLFDYILPGWDKPDTYSAASDSMEAPSFQASVLAYLKVAKELNRIANIYSNYLISDEENIANQIIVDLGYEGKMSNLSKFRNILPILEGNTGDPISNGGQAVEDDVVHTPKAFAPGNVLNNMSNMLGAGIDNGQPQPPQQVQQPQPPQGQPQQMYPNHPVQSNVGYPNQQQPQQPQQQQPGVPGFQSYAGGYQRPAPTNPYAYPGQPTFAQQQPPVNPNDPIASWNANQPAYQPQFNHQGQPAYGMQPPPVNPFTVPAIPQPAYGGQQVPPGYPNPHQPMGVPGFRSYGGAVPPQQPQPQPMAYPPQGYPQQPYPPHYGYAPQQPVTGVGLFDKR